MANPFFTVYVPFHSDAYADAARRALDSLESQSFQSFEIIVVVNGTNVPYWCNPVSFLSETRAAFGRLIVAGRFPTLAAASNAALAMARGYWIVRLDADDTMEPDALYEFVRTIMPERSARGGNDHFVVAGHWDNTGELYGAGLAIPVLWLRSIGGYDENRPLGDGRFIRERLEAQHGKREGRQIIRTGYPVYEYNRHASSMTRIPGSERENI